MLKLLFQPQGITVGERGKLEQTMLIGCNTSSSFNTTTLMTRVSNSQYTNDPIEMNLALGSDENVLMDKVTRFHLSGEIQASLDQFSTKTLLSLPEFLILQLSGLSNTGRV